MKRILKLIKKDIKVLKDVDKNKLKGGAEISSGYNNNNNGGGCPPP